RELGWSLLEPLGLRNGQRPLRRPGGGRRTLRVWPVRDGPEELVRHDGPGDLSLRRPSAGPPAAKIASSPSRDSGLGTADASASIRAPLPSGGPLPNGGLSDGTPAGGGSLTEESVCRRTGAAARYRLESLRPPRSPEGEVRRRALDTLRRRDAAAHRHPIGLGHWFGSDRDRAGLRGRLF